MGIAGELGVEEGLVVHDETVVRTFSYLAVWSAVRAAAVRIWEVEEGLMKGVLTGSVDPSTVAFSAMESFAAEVWRSLMLTEPFSLTGPSVGGIRAADAGEASGIAVMMPQLKKGVDRDYYLFAGLESLLMQDRRLMNYWRSSASYA